MTTKDEAEYRMWDLRRDANWLTDNIDRLIQDIDPEELFEVAAELRRVARHAEDFQQSKAA